MSSTDTSNKTNERDLENQRLIANGDFDALYKKNYSLVIALTKKYNFHLDDFEEAISIANIGFVKALKLYDPEKSCFSTYLGMSIKSALSKDYRGSRAGKRYNPDITVVSLQQEISHKSGKNTTLEEAICLDVPSIEEMTFDRIRIKACLDYIKTLPNGKLYQELIALRMEGLTQTEISKRLNFSQAQISRRLTRIGKIMEDFETYDVNKQKIPNKIIRKGEMSMKTTKEPADRLEEVIALVEQDITEIEVIASMLNISKQIAKTYRFAALREIEKRKHPVVKKVEVDDEFEEVIETIAQEAIAEEMPIKEMIVTTPTKEKITPPISESNKGSVIETNNVQAHVAQQKRLKPINIASDDFEFCLENNMVLIKPVNTVEKLIIPKKAILAFIGDLKQIVNYL